MDAPDPTSEGRWRPRPLLAFALRLVSVLVPAAAGAASAYAFVTAVPLPVGLGGVPWFLALATVSTIATAFAERIGRRFLPLAVLLRLSLAFPDRAPSRFAMARGAGNVRNLERRIREARERSLDPEPARAAEQILGLVAALSAHDRKTRGHSERVRAFTDLLADEMRLPEKDRDRLRWASLLHDIGKLHVPSRILNKAGRPEPHEWVTLQAHPAEGARIAAPLLPWLGEWGRAIEQHHERFDGGGYPAGVAGEEIAHGARIVAVADSFEVMTAARSYKKPISVPAARRELAACAGGQFDPAIVRAFLNVSIGRLWWTVGPAAWTALVPVIGPVQRAGGQLVGAARAGAAALAVAAGGVVPFATGVAAASVANPSDVSAPGEAPAGIPDGEIAIGYDGPDDASEGDRGAPTSESGDRVDGSEGPSDDEPVDDTSDPVGGVTDAVDDAVDDTTDALDDAVDDTTDALDDAVDDTTDALDDVVDGTTDVVDGVLPGATDAVDDAVDGTTDELDGVVDGITDLPGSLLGG